MHMESVSLWSEPRKEILKQITCVDGEPEMTEWESSFLCGLVREYRPKKLLEVGVAGGATTAILLKAIDMLELQTEFHSVDLAEKFYRDTGKLTGFLGIEAKTYVGNIKHTFHLGNVLPTFINEIGGGIDFVILDTVHWFPGEIFDFLVVFPLLTENAVVVCHDISYQHYGKSKEGFATHALLNGVAADRFWMMDNSPERINGYPNIGAFRLNRDTKQYISNQFSMLMLPWGYFPSDEMLEYYLESITENYDEECVYLFQTAVQLNKHTRDKRPQKMSWYSRIRKCGKIIIRGY